MTNVNSANATSTHAIGHVFSMVGAKPNTEWLGGCVALDATGFILAGSELSADALSARGWSRRRAPLLLETSLPRVFAVGDVRSGSVKRVVVTSSIAAVISEMDM